MSTIDKLYEGAIKATKEPGFATRLGKNNCYILAADVMEHYAAKFPLSRSGWTAARDHAVKISQSRAAYVTLVCPTDNIPLYQCHKGHCQIEGSEGDEVVAGARRRKRK